MSIVSITRLNRGVTTLKILFFARIRTAVTPIRFMMSTSFVRPPNELLIANAIDGLK